MYSEFLPFTVSKPDIETLCKIHEYLIYTCTYENLSVYYEPFGISLDKKVLFDKFTNNRGGFCLELNTFYYSILVELGYQVVKRSAVVLIDYDGIPRLDTHQVLITQINGEKWLTDIGASEFTPTHPIKLVHDETGMGAGGYEIKLIHGTFEDEIGWRFEVWNRSKYPTVHHQLFFFFKDKDYPDSHYEEMAQRLSTPATCPPRPYYTEFVTRALPGNNRMNIIGTKDNGYTFYIKDKNGIQIEKQKVSSNDFPQFLRQRFFIDLGPKSTN